ncbi:MAG: hypothetical protein ACRDLB_02210, partial [Actinomycetota bacterium]
TPTSPTEPPTERHARDISVKFAHGSLIVSGRISVDDGTNKCRKRVPVKVQRRITKGKRKGKYATVKQTVTNRKGRYSVSIRDRTGKYKVKAVKTKKGRFNQDVCRRTKTFKRHRHRR